MCSHWQWLSQSPIVCYWLTIKRFTVCTSNVFAYILLHCQQLLSLVLPQITNSHWNSLLVMLMLHCQFKHSLLGMQWCTLSRLKIDTNMWRFKSVEMLNKSRYSLGWEFMWMYIRSLDGIFFSHCLFIMHIKVVFISTALLCLQW